YRHEVLSAVDDQQRTADLRRQPFKRALPVQLNQRLFIVNLPDVRYPGEFERVIEAVQHTRAIVHPTRKGAGFDARVACRRTGRKITSHARAENTEPMCVDLR